MGQLSTCEKPKVNKPASPTTYTQTVPPAPSPRPHIHTHIPIACEAASYKFLPEDGLSSLWRQLYRPHKGPFGFWKQKRQWRAVQPIPIEQIGTLGFPGDTIGEEPTCQCRRYKRCRFDPWVGKIPQEKGMATPSSILAWRIPWTEEPGGLQSIGFHRVGLY